MARAFRHRKRGTSYEFVGLAKMQIGTKLFNENQTQITSKNLFEKLEAMSFVVYRSFADDTLWVRPESEFFDGRFEELISVRHTG